MISVNVLDPFAVPVKTKPPAERDLQPAREDRAFARSLREASDSEASAVPSTQKPEPKPTRRPTDADSPERADATAAEAAAEAPPAADAPAPATEASAADDAGAVADAGELPVESSGNEPVQAPATAVAAPALLRPAAAPAVPVVTDVLITSTAPQPTSAAPAPTIEATRAPTETPAPITVAQDPVAAEQSGPTQTPAVTQAAVPAPQQSVAPRPEAASTDVDDADATSVPDSPSGQRPRVEHDPTRLPLPVGDNRPGTALRDGATQQQVRQQRHETAVTQRADAVELRTSAPAPAYTTGGSISPAAELAKVLLPETGLDDLPAPANVASDAVQASSALRPAPSATTETNAASPSPTIRGATLIDAHDSGAGFRLEGGGSSTAATPVDRLTQVLASSTTPRSSFIRLQLDPPELGQLRIEVRMNHDALTLRVQTETAAVKGLIEERMGELKAAMEHQGIRVDRVEVDVKPQPGSSNARGEHDGRDPGSREQAAPWDAPRDAGNWRESQGDRDGAFETETSTADDVLAAATGSDIHLVTTESSVDVLI